MTDPDALIKPLMQKDLRILLRARGLSPAGGIDEQRERLRDDMIKTNNYSVDLGGGESKSFIGSAARMLLEPGKAGESSFRPKGPPTVACVLGLSEPFPQRSNTAAHRAMCE